MSKNKDMIFRCEIEVNDTKVEKEFLVLKPNYEHQQEAQKVYNTWFSNAVQSKAILRAKLEDFMLEQGLWDDKKETKAKELRNQIATVEKQINEGGITLSTAKDLAFQLRKLRAELARMSSVRSDLDSNTAEGQADNARFNYLVSQCLVYNDTKKPYFSSFDDYMKRNSEEVAILAAQKLAFHLYGLEDDFEQKLPENEFLLEFKFINDNLQTLNKEGHAVDDEGRLVDKDGRWIAYDEDGKPYFVNQTGVRINDDNTYDKSNRKPFLTDEGQPIE